MHTQEEQMASRFVAIRRRSNIGKQCMHCRKTAEWVAIRKQAGERFDAGMQVRYCDDHKRLIIDMGATRHA